MAEERPPSPFPKLPAGYPTSSPLSLVAGALMAAEKAEILAGQFRRSEADDPDTFIASWAVVMADFPPVVLDFVCHPAKGLAIQSNWVPTVKEVREACIAHMSSLIAAWQVERIPPERRLSSRPETFRITEDRSQRKTLEELKAKHGPNWGLRGDDPVPRQIATSLSPAYTKDQIIDHYQNHGLAMKPKKEKRDARKEKQDEGRRVVADADPQGGSLGEGEPWQADSGIEAAADSGIEPAQGRTRREKV